MQTKLIHEKRAPKSKTELDNIIKAQRISERVLGDTLKILKVGITEIYVQDFIKKSFVKYKAPVLSFSPIVAFGKNTANIHHEPGKTKLKKGDIIMFDFGTTISDYCSDMTRTYFYGEPTEEQKKVYIGVLNAMDRAMLKLSKGEKRANIIDKEARSYLDRKFGMDAFPHGLGHGVGTVIHEWPNLKASSKDILPVGCVMTIEPGVYFEGFGGVRIEDMILITKKGYQNLTNVPKDLESIIIKI